MNVSKRNIIYVGTAAPGRPVERSSTATAGSTAQPGMARHDSRGRLSLHGLVKLLMFVLVAASLTSAQTLTGTVKNSTTGKPASGDEVVLLSLGQGMEEAGRTKADTKGNFSFDLKNAQGPHLVRAIHQGVTYHRMAPPGTTSVEVEVYDVGKKIEGINVVADIMRIQTEQGQLEIMRQFAVENTSKPPRTQMNERNLEFYVPEGAKIVDGSAMTEGGNPLTTAPVPVDDKKTRYAFLFPLRPGMTRFEVAYQLPYTGNANIDPKTIYPLEHFVAMVPKAMQFSAASGTHYEQREYPAQPDANLEVSSQVEPNQALAFKISGEGVLQSQQENAGASNAGPPGQGGSAQPESRPGGGLGPPIDAPPPLQKYQWWILGGFALALTIGGVYVASRQQASNRAARPKTQRLEEIESVESEETTHNIASNQASTRPQTPPATMLLEGLKEELFQLEVDRQQGRISPEEYEKSKSALDYTLQRALKREAEKA
jgi:hypothetical protein